MTDQSTQAEVDSSPKANENYLATQNRDLAWLKFNQRVLEESSYTQTPLLERLKFVGICANNLDEFFMVRVGSLADFSLFAPDFVDNKTGMKPEQILKKIYQESVLGHALMEQRFFDVTHGLKEVGIEHVDISDLSDSERKQLKKQFEREILPLLSPYVMRKQQPFPHMDNKTLHVAVKLSKKVNTLYGITPVPKTMSRLVYLKPESKEGKPRFKKNKPVPETDTQATPIRLRYLLLEEVIHAFVHLLFKGYDVQEKTVLSVTRNADLNLEEARRDDEIVDYPKFMKKLLSKRQRLAPVRLQLQHPVGDKFERLLRSQLNLKGYQVFTTRIPLELGYCFSLGKRWLSEGHVTPTQLDDLIYKQHVPHNRYPDKKIDLMAQIKRQDLLFFYPFEAMWPFLALLHKAADDDRVTAIAITLYRLDIQSKLADSLIRAAENGKKVTVIMEIRARFDEANNIDWAEKMLEAGCTVIYGLANYKVHSKLCVITRQTAAGKEHITQIGTGNYNEQTAKIYTDYSFMTANPAIGEDATRFFEGMLAGDTGINYNHLWVAPHYFKQNILASIAGETAKAVAGKQAQIILKCNSLTDKKVIDGLIEASQAGVKVYLIVRGSCCLIPGVVGYSENIQVMSIIGRFLEHTRVYSFGVTGQETIYIASADLMTRNTQRRVEIACPILDEAVKNDIRNHLNILLQDNTKAWDQTNTGDYVLRQPSHPNHVVNSQQHFRMKAIYSNRQDQPPKPTEV